MNCHWKHPIAYGGPSEKQIPYGAIHYQNVLWTPIWKKVRINFDPKKMESCHKFPLPQLDNFRPSPKWDDPTSTFLPPKINENTPPTHTKKVKNTGNPFR